MTLFALPWGGPPEDLGRGLAFSWKPQIFTIHWPAAAPPAAKLLPFAWPAHGLLTSRYGIDGHRWHPGIDIGTLRTLRVGAAVKGRVLYTGYAAGFEGYGKVVVERSGRYLVLYAHLARVRVHAGQRVDRGLRIGTAGCTGSCTGTHLHFEVRRGTRTVDPMRLLRRKNHRRGLLAQLGEHQLDKLGVTGSSPVPPIREKALQKQGLFRLSSTGECRVENHP